MPVLALSQWYFYGGAVGDAVVMGSHNDIYKTALEEMKPFHHPPTVTRWCLNCPRTFQSVGPQNRLCPTCCYRIARGEL